MKTFINDIKIESSRLIQKSDEELSVKIDEVKKRTQGGREPLETILVDWFALTQEISSRTLGLRHFDTQLAAGFLLHQGKIVEMKTGEGKTLASTLPVALNALSQKGVHVVTVNDYLAERDQNWMGKVYKGLGLTVGLVKSQTSFFKKQKSYQSDITYITNSELVFDYLRDSSASTFHEILQRPLNYCILDEIDSILIDEARTPLILSSFEGSTNLKKLYIAKALADRFQKDVHFQVDEKRKEISFTEKGYTEAKEKLGKNTLYEIEDPWILELLNALKAKYIFKLNKDYIVLNNKVLIVDEFTGRVMGDRRWSLGIHEAIEIKEKVTIGKATETKNSITYQNFFTLYPKLAGMTGTAKTAEKEFQDIYNLEVVVLPTAKPMLRKDLPDLVYQNEWTKWQAILNQSKECFEKGQPILIGTANVEKSEFLSELFQSANLPHQILNAKPENVARESEIVAQAGKRSAVTIATNMAGRGTDIILGGNRIFQVKEVLSDLFFPKLKKNVPYQVTNQVTPTEASVHGKPQDQFLVGKLQLMAHEPRQNGSFPSKMLIDAVIKEYSGQEQTLASHIQNLPYSLEFALPSLKVLYQVFYDEIDTTWKIENSIVKNLGGLFVLGTERHETRRIDNQLRGRSGRQGDPGISQFFVSLEDELIKVFGGEKIQRAIESLLKEKDVPIESSFVTGSLEQAQQKIELYNYDIRKNVFQYDNVLNNQRKQLFCARKEILCDNQVLFLPLLLHSAESSFDRWSHELELRYKAYAPFKKARFEKSFEPYSFLNPRQSCKEIPSESLEVSKKLQMYTTVGSSKSFIPTSATSATSATPVSVHPFQPRTENIPMVGITQDQAVKEYKQIWISSDLRFAKFNQYEKGFLQNTQIGTLLEIVDFYWTEHIERMSAIRETIQWRSYGQQNPLVEYSFEAFQSFQRLFYQIQKSMLYWFLENPLIISE